MDIGIMDSGLGGLSVWEPIHRLMPEVGVHYVADRAWCPYGPRPAQEVIRRVETLVRFFLKKDCRCIVLACNTATAAAIEYLRSQYDVPFVGMEPAVKPAAIHTQSGVVGVLATAGTLESAKYKRMLAQFGHGKKVVARVGKGWVEAVEQGNTDSPETLALVRDQVEPLLAAGADQLVLGCTHYPFIEPLIRRVAGPSVQIINPAPAVAQQVKRVLIGVGIQETAARREGEQRFYATAGVEGMDQMLRRMGYLEYKTQILNL